MWDQRALYVQQGHSTRTYIASEVYWDWYAGMARTTMYLSKPYNRKDPTQRVLPPRFTQQTSWPIEYKQRQPWMWQVPEGPWINPAYRDPA